MEYKIKTNPIEGKHIKVNFFNHDNSSLLNSIEADATKTIEILKDNRIPSVEDDHHNHKTSSFINAENNMKLSKNRLNHNDNLYNTSPIYKSQSKEMNFARKSKRTR